MLTTLLKGKKGAEALNFTTIIILAIIYYFLRDENEECTRSMIIQQKNNIFNPDIYEIRHKK